ncbi:MAG: spondin domain-containing protein [Candidatus Sericytochromatia bacterium]
MFKHALLASLTLALLLSACSQDTPLPNQSTDLHGSDLEVSFTLKIENISQNTTLPSALSPLAWVLAERESPLFKEGQSAGPLAALAEDGNPDPLLDSLQNVLSKGHLPDPVAPGQSTTLTFKAKPGAVLGFASMLAESNDVFVGLSADHLELFDASNEPIAPGALTLALWDAGSEVNQEPGKGDAQGPRQAAPNTGSAETQSVRHLDEVNDGFNYPEVGQLLRITLSHDHEHDHAEEDHAEEGHDHAADHAH